MSMGTCLAARNGDASKGGGVACVEIAGSLRLEGVAQLQTGEVWSLGRGCS